MKRKLIVAVLLFCFIISFSSCTFIEKIHINGEVEETVELGTEFVDKGVSYPKEYSLITYGKVNSSVLGRYELIYKVFDDNGEFVKELHRFVSVLDTTPPTYTPAEQQNYYVGIKYDVEDFIKEYSDNDTSYLGVTFSQYEFSFDTPGEHSIEITLIDNSNNTSTYKTTVKVVLDIEKLLYHKYENAKYKINSTVSDDGVRYTRVEIDLYKTFSYFSSGSLHYLETVTTSLGNRASIQISADFGCFDNASISYHISGTQNTYSVGFANIDATQENLSINKFSSTINNLDLDTNLMLKELNQKINTVVNNFRNYMQNTLNLPLVNN